FWPTPQGPYRLQDFLSALSVSASRLALLRHLGLRYISGFLPMEWDTMQRAGIHVPESAQGPLHCNGPVQTAKNQCVCMGLPQNHLPAAGAGFLVARRNSPRNRIATT